MMLLRMNNLFARDRVGPERLVEKRKGGFLTGRVDDRVETLPAAVLEDDLFAVQPIDVGFYGNPTVPRYGKSTWLNVACSRHIGCSGLFRPNRR